MFRYIYQQYFVLFTIAPRSTTVTTTTATTTTTAAATATAAQPPLLLLEQLLVQVQVQQQLILLLVLMQLRLLLLLLRYHHYYHSGTGKKPRPTEQRTHLRPAPAPPGGPCFCLKLLKNLRLASLPSKRCISSRSENSPPLPSTSSRHA